MGRGRPPTTRPPVAAGTAGKGSQEGTAPVAQTHSSRAGTPAASSTDVRALRELERSVKTCTACNLHRDRTKPVVGEGAADAPIMVVGSVPRRHEDLQGRPFAGAAANVLDNAMLAAGLSRDVCYLATVVKCRPGEDRAPSQDEVASCLPFLRAQIDIVSPRVIVSLGAFVTSLLLGRPVPIERVAGYRFDVLQGITLIPSYHPTDAVRGVSRAAGSLRRDLATAKAVLDGRLSTGAEALAELRSRQAASH